jgi:hypothetical protein
MSPAIDGPGAERWRDLDLERSVLGAVLLEPAVAAQYRAAGLVPALFSHPAHQAIWEAAAALEAEGARPDFPLLRLRLNDRGTLEEAGGPAGAYYGLAIAVPAPGRYLVTHYTTRGGRDGERAAADTELVINVGELLEELERATGDCWREPVKTGGGR